MRFDDENSGTGGRGPGTVLPDPVMAGRHLPTPGWPAGPTGPYSAWWKRAIAELIDLLILTVLVGVVGFMLGIVAVDRSQLSGDVVMPAALDVAFGILLLVAPIAYHVAFEGSARGATPGKMALGIQVRDASTFGPIGYVKALARCLVATVLWWALVLPGVLDLLAPLWDPRRQTWHDKAAGTVVQDVRR